jgi:hypothetical protein
LIDLKIQADVTCLRQKLQGSILIFCEAIEEAIELEELRFQAFLVLFYADDGLKQQFVELGLT